MNVKVGDFIEEGTIVCKINSMKVEHSVFAPYPLKCISFPKKVGDHIRIGEPLLFVEPLQSNQKSTLLKESARRVVYIFIYRYCKYLL